MILTHTTIQRFSDSHTQQFSDFLQHLSDSQFSDFPQLVTFTIQRYVINDTNYSAINSVIEIHVIWLFGGYGLLTTFELIEID